MGGTTVLEAAEGTEIFILSIRRVDTFCFEEEGTITGETLGTERKVTFLGTGETGNISIDSKIDLGGTKLVNGTLEVKPTLSFYSNELQHKLYIIY